MKILLRNAVPGNIVSLLGNVYLVREVSAAPYGPTGTVQMYSATLNKKDEWVPGTYATTWDWAQEVRLLSASEVRP